MQNMFNQMDAQNEMHRLAQVASDEPGEVVPTQPYPMTAEERLEYETEYNRYLEVLRFQADNGVEEAREMVTGLY